MDDQLLLLFSSNWEALYAQNAIDLTAVPSGSLLHFRYKDTWLGRSFREKLESDVSALNGTKLLCLFVDRTIHADICVIVPTRFGRLVRADRYGDVWHIYFTVHEYFDWTSLESSLQEDSVSIPKNAEDRIRLLVTFFRQSLLDGLKRDDSLNGPPEIWATICENKQILCRSNTLFFAGTEASADKDWQYLVRVFHALDYFRDTVFFRVKSIECLDEKYGWTQELWPGPWPIRWSPPKVRDIEISQIGDMMNGYRMRRCHPHRIKIVVDNGKELSATMKACKIEVSYESTVFVGQKQSLPVAAKHDVHEVILFPIFGAPDTLTPVEIGMAASSGSAQRIAKADLAHLQNIWLLPADIRQAEDRNLARKNQGKKISTAIPDGPAPVGPKLTILFKTVHSRRYLKIGGGFLILGLIFQFLITEQVLRAVAKSWKLFGALPNNYDWARMWVALLLIKGLALYFLFVAFVLTTRKLPSVKN